MCSISCRDPKITSDCGQSVVPILSPPVLCVCHVRCALSVSLQDLIPDKVCTNRCVYVVSDVHCPCPCRTSYLTRFVQTGMDNILFEEHWHWWYCSVETMHLSQPVCDAWAIPGEKCQLSHLGMALPALIGSITVCDVSVFTNNEYLFILPWREKHQLPPP